MDQKTRRAAIYSAISLNDVDEIATLFPKVPFGLMVLDGDMRYLRVNERMAEINGVPVEAHIGKMVSEIGSHTGLVLDPIFRYAMQEDKSLEDLQVEVPSDSSGDINPPGCLLVSCFPSRSDDGTVQRIHAVVQDITEQKLKEVAQDERLRFEALLSALSAEFINTAVAEVDTKVEQGLKTIYDFLGVDRTTIALLSPADDRLHSVYTYALPGIKHPPEIVDSHIPEWVKMIRQGEMFHIEDIDDLPDSQWCEKKYCKEMGGIKSVLFIPLCVGGRVLGLFSAVSYSRKKIWMDLYIQRFRILGEIFANVLERKRVDQNIQKAFVEIGQLKDRLEAENHYLRDKIETELKNEEIIGQSTAIKHVLLQVKQVAATLSTVLIQGETGTGKELIARAIHARSDRKDRPMIKLNCAALPSTLIEAELFGHEKGAYTGAATRRAGRFEAANGSTIFLDEIGELPLELQAKLLRVLQEGQFERLGSHTTVNVDVRVIAATNRDLALEIKGGRFREDLFYRLNVFPIFIPPLRERREDIQALVWSMVREFESVFGKTIERIQKKTMESLECYSWPGNIRELRNMIERAMITTNSSTLVVNFPDMATTTRSQNVSMKEIERVHILAMLEKTGWRIRGKNGAAEVLELNPSTLEFRMKKLGIRRKTAQHNI
ncbi:MAG: sigma 54-interacting transcriptional regulator [Desulfuromonadaceae bacterium]|nr:sigma 54-interacting transcriptional regulator [Desulfuromonadaceae bacterium]